MNQDVPNPNALNRPLAWPIKIKTSVNSTDQVSRLTGHFPAKCQPLRPNLPICQDEIIEVVITALEKFHWENRDIAFWVKAELDKRMGCSWHVVVGEEFGFDITYEVRRQTERSGVMRALTAGWQHDLHLLWLAWSAPLEMWDPASLGDSIQTRESRNGHQD